MAAFSEDKLREMEDQLATSQRRARKMKERLVMHKFRTEIAREFSGQGLARRIDAIAYSLGRVFEAVPPDLEGLPNSDQRAEATAHIQTVSFNVYGCFDNLAHIWVAENGVRKPNGKALSRGEIGFVPKCNYVRRSLPERLLGELEALDPWFAHLEEFRHTTAHRVPLYIPPFMIAPENVERYRELDNQSLEALRQHEFENYEELIASRNNLRHFVPLIATSVTDMANALFHPQLLIDFATVERWVGNILDALPTDQ